MLIISLLLFLFYFLQCTLSISYSGGSVQNTTRGTDYKQCRLRRQLVTDSKLCSYVALDNYGRVDYGDNRATFDQIRDVCDSELKYTPCRDTGGLVWPVYDWDGSYNCRCPKCRCGDNKIRIEYSRQRTLDSNGWPRSECIRCSCDWEDAYGDEVLTCTLNSDDNGYVWNDFVCPKTPSPTPSPTTPKGLDGCWFKGNKYELWDAFWDNTTSNCQDFCVCMPDKKRNGDGGNVTCARSYSEISQNTIWYQKFIENCKDSITRCYPTTEFGNIYPENYTDNERKGFCLKPLQTSSGCPYCGCSNPPNVVTDTSMVESIVFDKHNQSNTYWSYQCSDCTCRSISDLRPADNRTHATTGYYPAGSCNNTRAGLGTYTKVSECSLNVYSCATSATVNNTAKTKRLCKVTDDNNWCSMYAINYVSFPGKICNDPSVDTTYGTNPDDAGCEQDYICRAFNVFRANSDPVKDPPEVQRNQHYCQSINYTAAVFDCENDEWVKEEVEVNVTLKCCVGTECNVPPFEPSCDRGATTNGKQSNLALSNFFKARLEAEHAAPSFYYSDNLISQLAFCKQTLKYRNYWSHISGSNSKICAYLAKHFQANTFKKCGELNGLIDALKTKTGEEQLIRTIENVLNQSIFSTYKTNYEKYRNYYGCKWEAKCDPGSDAIMARISLVTLAVIMIIINAMN